MSSVGEMFQLSAVSTDLYKVDVFIACFWHLLTKGVALFNNCVCQIRHRASENEIFIICISFCNSSLKKPCDVTQLGLEMFYCCRITGIFLDLAKLGLSQGLIH